MTNPIEILIIEDDLRIADIHQAVHRENRWLHCRRLRAYQ